MESTGPTPCSIVMGFTLVVYNPWIRPYLNRGSGTGEHSLVHAEKTSLVHAHGTSLLHAFETLKQQTTNNKETTTNNKQTTNKQQQTTTNNNKQQITNNKQQTTNNNKHPRRRWRRRRWRRQRRRPQQQQQQQQTEWLPDGVITWLILFWMEGNHLSCPVFECGGSEWVWRDKQTTHSLTKREGWKRGCVYSFIYL